MNRFLRAKLSLVAQIVSKVCVNWTQPIQYRDLRRLEVSPFGLRSLRLSLKGFLLGYDGARIASPEGVASQDEANAFSSALRGKLSFAMQSFSVKRG